MLLFWRIFCPASDENARKINAERLYLYDHEQVHVPEHDDRKVMEQVSGLLGTRIFEQIWSVEHHRGQNGAEAEQESALVVEHEQRQTVVFQWHVAGHARYQTRQPNVLPQIGLGHLRKLDLRVFGAKVERQLHENEQREHEVHVDGIFNELLRLGTKIIRIHIHY